MKSKLFLLVGLILVSVLLSGCTSQTQDNLTTTSTTTSKENLISINFKVVLEDGEVYADEIVEVEPGTNAFEAMKQVLEVEYQEYPGLGVFVTKINNVEAGPTHYWALRVNRRYADKGIDSYILNEDTQITWTLEKIKEFQGQ